MDQKKSDWCHVRLKFTTLDTKVDLWTFVMISTKFVNFGFNISIYVT